MPTEPAGVQVPQRLVPFPRSISPEARRYLAQLVGPDGLPHNMHNPELAPDDWAGWAAQKRLVSQMLAERVAPVAAGLRATLETVNLAGVTVHVGTPEVVGAAEGRAYLDVHGGGLVHGDGEFCRIGAGVAADQHGVLSYAVDYRMPPEHPYPAALDDCVAVYRALLARHAPQDIIVGGNSAGGNLATALTLRARDEGLPLPAALVLISPEVDLTESGDSFETNRIVDLMLSQPLMSSNLLYAAGHDLAHPYLSPLFGDFSRGFPPTFIQAGTRDLFLSNAVRMHRALRRAAVPVELHISEGMPHGGFPGAPEDLELAGEIRRFVAAHWGSAPK